MQINSQSVRSERDHALDWTYQDILHARVSEPYGMIARQLTVR